MSNSGSSVLFVRRLLERSYHANDARAAPHGSRASGTAIVPWQVFTVKQSHQGSHVMKLPSIAMLRMMEAGSSSACTKYETVCTHCSQQINDTARGRLDQISSFLSIAYGYPYPTHPSPSSPTSPHPNLTSYNKPVPTTYKSHSKGTRAIVKTISR